MGGRTQNNSARQEQMERKGGRRLTVQMLFIINAIALLAMFFGVTDALSYIVENLFGTEWLFMLKGICGAVIVGAQVLGWWSAKMGD